METKKIKKNKSAEELLMDVLIDFDNKLTDKLDNILNTIKRQQKEIKTANETISKLTEENKSLKDYKGWYEAKCKETLSNASLLDILLEPYRRLLLFIKKQKSKYDVKNKKSN